ncbi:MAG: hypothetical protein A2599_02915 [Candidatus Staskawiczbacteria bacterium RIFOXYD1_FULL_39_28]|uniref:CDP-diacylglycerol--glycerol-3-phosphate 3-phosphatidyltransferase n=1 Tax=Candidatus Staskawiczbacteria bacterium RIFOXYC1_FULL_38_18 TaxID=1802229 RepID=A0A1G2JED5_9BACT|nr:MAG: hypothetical protein A2401_01090 [Candidatus Staskawiczbacteria bacterium RIFOXYC1_FULL_38_18]OGZ92327.1 MAG: hypothetical protein A2599_02915 [Candidatus Staskawiczbacteria bacterium RIFOXYD1_FULL_39_28]
MKKFLGNLQNFLEKVDSYRDKFLFLFIKPRWPRKITPNHLTWTRVFLAVLLFALLFFFNVENKTLILALFCIGVFTDLLDGPVARGTDRVTEFGAMLDSTADRLLILPIAVYSLFSQHKWLLLAIILVEIINAFASIFYKSKEIYLESNIFGKTKMVLQSIVFIAILLAFPKAPSEIFIDTLWFSLIFTFLSILTRVMDLKSKGYIKNKLINKQLNKLQ